MPYPILIGSEWKRVKTTKTTPVHNPSTGEVIARTPI
jgi:acyl-CoA reductase-like NAD-dependent aldehyde dehydrogenase